MAPSLDAVSMLRDLPEITDWFFNFSGQKSVLLIRFSKNLASPAFY